jgi:hypothetical protein
MNEPIILEAIDYKGLKIEITPALRPEDPFEHSGRLGTFAFFDRKGNYRNEAMFTMTDFNGWDAMRAHIEDDLNAVCLPVYCYRHGADTISTKPFSCAWDSGQLGFTFATPKKMRMWYGWKYATAKRRAKAQRLLEAEIQLYDRYVSGEVYRWVLRDCTGEELFTSDSLYGMEDTMDDAKSWADSLRNNEVKTAIAYPGPGPV